MFRVRSNNADLRVFNQTSPMTSLWLRTTIGIDSKIKLNFLCVFYLLRLPVTFQYCSRNRRLNKKCILGAIIFFSLLHSKPKQKQFRNAPGGWLFGIYHCSIGPQKYQKCKLFKRQFRELFLSPQKAESWIKKCQEP